MLKTAMRPLMLFVFALFFCVLQNPLSFAAPPESAAKIRSHWEGKKVAFLGDSITDKRHVGTKKNYWQYLEESLGIKPAVYGINGHTFQGILSQAEKLKKDTGGDVDAIIIFAGTNDYNAGVPLGQWYDVRDDEAPVADGKTQTRKRRFISEDSGTFRGRINVALSYIKDNFPDKQVILLTPIHRGFAQFGKRNVQPDESFPNRIGLYIDDYVNALKEAATVWAVPVIDLNSVSGLYPSKQSHARYFHNKDTDMLHPNADGHYRMAKAIAFQLAAFPADFD